MVAGGSGLRDAAVRLMRGFSVEQTPAELARRAAFPATMPAGTKVYLTWIAGAPFSRTVAAAARVRELGMVPVPHLAARAIADAATLDRMLLELRREAAVDDLLLIAGSQPRPAGAFADTLQLLLTARFGGSPWRSLSFAAHPEGTAVAGAAALARALSEKDSHAAASAVPHELVTQFGFDAAPLLAWEQRTRPISARLPVRVGLAGLASLPTLLRYAALCGVAASSRALLRERGSALRLAGGGRPGRIVAAVARASLVDPGARFRGFHFYPFGSLDETADWAGAIAAGAFTLDGEESDIVA